MDRRIPLWLCAAMLAGGAAAGEIELEIPPANPQWVMPPLICRNSAIGLPVCLDARATVRSAADFRPPMQQQPEGVPEPGEEQVLLDVGPFVAAGNYVAALDRIRSSYPEIALLEIGDGEGFRRVRMPTRGGGVSAVPPAPAGRPQERQGDNGTVSESRSIRPPSALGPSNAALRPGGPSPLVISASLLYLIGHSYFALERYVPAEAAFELGLIALPTHARMHESLGMLYLATERYADARERLARAAELGRSTAHLHAALGYAAQRTHRYAAAASAFQRALVLEPKDRGIRRGLLEALTSTREHLKAQTLVAELLRDEPDDPTLWLYRAQIALQAGDAAVAAASLETAMRLGDDSLANRRACAELHLQNGNVARAAELLRGAAARSVDFALVDRVLGWLEDESEWERFRELLGSLDRPALDGAQQSRLLTRRASLALHDGNRRGASTALQEALALDPANPTALLALGRLYHGDRDYGRAALYLRRAIVYPTSREAALVAGAEAAIALDDFDGAVTLLRNAAVGNPTRADLQRNIDVLEDILVLRTQR